jgi:RHS repeat-associated protein
MDGLGHAVQSQLTTDPDGPTNTVNVYDGFGRVYKSYNPTRCTTPTSNCGELTWGYTTYAYDALGRVTTVTAQDGQTTNTSYSGNCTTVTDPALKSRKSCSDGLGRLTQVFEDPAVLKYETDYTYDALNDLTRVDQWGGPNGSSGDRVRTFTYDSLSRLLCASNPENSTASCPITASGSYTPGTTGYTYDANGNLATKTSPKPNQTGTASVAATYSYDALNRLTQKSFNDGATATVKYGYDGIAPSGCTPTVLTIDNGIGKRTSMCDAAGAEAWSYDITPNVGWKTTVARTTNNLTKTIVSQANLDGSTNTITAPSYPDGSHVVTQSYQQGGAGRPTQLMLNANYVTTGVKYTPAGQACYMQLDWNGEWITTKTFNNRLQPTTIQGIQQWPGHDPAIPACAVAPIYANGYTFTEVDLKYNFLDANSHNNGNVITETNNLVSGRTQNFTYDSLNRLSTAQTNGTHATDSTNCWAETYTYDPWGNLYTYGANLTLQSAYIGCSQESGISTTATAKNQLANQSYDAAGNVISAPGVTYTYDAENHLVSAAGVNYTYDGDGNRVMKSNGTLYWYGTNSAPLMETDLSNNYKAVYCFFNGERIARSLGDNQLDVYFSDHLGNARGVYSYPNMILTDFYPFGGERDLSTGAVPNAYKFTGKERDSESGLDNFGARYNSSSIGRFMTPDSPSYSNHKNPQSWNLYAYSLNNPVTFRDADGHKIDCANNVAQCQADAAASAANAQAAARVTTKTTTTQHSFLGFWHYTTTETQIAITGDINSFRNLSTNAAKLADLVTSDRTLSVHYDTTDKPTLGWADTGNALQGGSTSNVRMGVAVIDPTRTPGIFYDRDAISEGVPQSNTGEEFAHEVLGHIWGDWFGGAPAGSRGNMRDSIAAEDAVRALDPSRGQKGIESHHNYDEAPELKGPND